MKICVNWKVAAQSPRGGTARAHHRLLPPVDVLDDADDVGRQRVRHRRQCERVVRLQAEIDQLRLERRDLRQRRSADREHVT